MNMATEWFLTRVGSILLLLVQLVSVQCEKDSNYYPDGFTNPNAGHLMYWRDSSNVLQDLSTFSKLYVSFHNCAWSPYGNANEDNSCGIQGGGGNDGDGSTWYMGYTECFRANAAYSLYGIVQGKEDVGCTKKTFINSFFTTTGVETFTSAMTTAGYDFTSISNGNNYNGDDAYAGGVSSACTITYQNDDKYNNNNNNNNNNKNNNNNNKNNNYNYAAAHNSKSTSAGTTSYGLGCQSDSFVYKTYEGAYCDGNDVLKVDNQLKTFNKEIGKANCMLIYSSYDQQDNGQGQSSNGLNLLTYSTACDVRQFPHTCPDPYGLLNSYSNAIASATAMSMHPTRERIKAIFSWLILIWGTILILASMSLILFRRRRSQSTKKHCRQEKKENRKRPFLFWKRLRSRISLKRTPSTAAVEH